MCKFAALDNTRRGPRPQWPAPLMPKPNWRGFPGELGRKGSPECAGAAAHMLEDAHGGMAPPTKECAGKTNQCRPVATCTPELVARTHQLPHRASRPAHAHY